MVLASYSQYNCKLHALTKFTCYTDIGLKKVKEETTAQQILTKYTSKHNSMTNTNITHL